MELRLGAMGCSLGHHKAPLGAVEYSFDIRLNRAATLVVALPGTVIGDPRGRPFRLSF